MHFPQETGGLRGGGAIESCHEKHRIASYKSDANHQDTSDQMVPEKVTSPSKETARQLWQQDTLRCMRS